MFEDNNKIDLEEIEQEICLDYYNLTILQDMQDLASDIQCIEDMRIVLRIMIGNLERETALKEQMLAEVI